MVLDHTVALVREIRRARAERLSRVVSPGEADAYRADVREAIQRAFSPWPEKTALRAQVTGKLDLPSCYVEKVTFESRPGYLVTANLYVPCDLKAPAPCVLGTCGHSATGKGFELYSAFCQRLAYAGFVVLIYDPVSQGERDQYYGTPYQEQIGLGVDAHNMMGKQLELLGENMALWRAWDGVRALDYLLSRPEVDVRHVGLTGNSGGGTMSTWLWAIEDRFTMAAPSCFVTTFLHNLENELPADAEQCPPGVIGAGLEMADFIIAGAPKPVLLMGQTYDYFDRRGLQAAYRDVSHVYRAYGVEEERVGLHIGPQGHGYSIHNQQAMVSFFCQQTGRPVVQVDEVESLDPSDLFAVPDGRVTAAGSTPVYELIAERARELSAHRPVLDEMALRENLVRLLGLSDDRSTVPHYRVPRPVRDGGRVLARYAVETEGHIRAILWKTLSEPAHPFTLDVEPEVHLYLPHVSAEEDLEDSLAVSFISKGPLSSGPLPLYALDVRGLGASMPEEQRPGFFQPYGMDYMMHAYGGMLGQSYLGRRVWDVLRTMDLLHHEGAQTIHLYGRGQGAILAALAGLLHPQSGSVTLKNGSTSFLEWTQTPYVAWPAANCLFGVLEVCDLPDVIRALGDRVRCIEPWDAEMRDSAT